MRMGTLVIFFLCALSLTECETRKAYPSDQYGVRPLVAKWWCGNATCLDQKP